jgi:hypothetical protein
VKLHHLMDSTFCAEDLTSNSNEEYQVVKIRNFSFTSYPSLYLHPSTPFGVVGIQYICMLPFSSTCFFRALPP